MLSRIKDIGGIDINTPTIILQEISKFMNIKVDHNKIEEPRYKLRLIDALIKSDNIIIKKPYTIIEYQKLAQYLNYDPNISWDLDSINKAYIFIRSLDLVTKDTAKAILKSKLKFGTLTPDSIGKIDLLSTYALIKKLNIKLDYEKVDMWQLRLKQYINININDMKFKIISQLDTIPKEFIFGIYTKLQKEPKTEILDLKLLEETYSNAQEIISKKEIIEDPKTNESAVVLAAIHHNIDISKVKTPLLVYHRLIEYPRYIDSFKKLNYYFNPRLPKCFYNENNIKRIASDMGYTNKEIKINDSYNLCLEVQHLNQFKHGRRKNSINTQTHINLTTINILNYHQCLSFGIKGNHYIYTYEELLLLFTQSIDLIPPNKNDNVIKRTLQEIYGVSEERSIDFGGTQERFWEGITWKL